MANAVGNRGTVVSICATAQDTDLTATQFAALDYVEICCTEEVPEFSSESNMQTGNCISGERLSWVGADAESDFEVVYYYQSSCVGQATLRGLALAKSDRAYAVKKVLNDGVAGVTAPTTSYARVILGGFSDGGGGIDDAVMHTVSGSIIQGPVFVAPAPIS